METKSKEISLAVDALEEQFHGFIQSLVRIPSLPGEEQKVQSFIADKLKALDLEVDVFALDDDALQNHPAFHDDGFSMKSRINVVGRWKGRLGDDSARGSARSLILNGHVDVVSPGDESLWEDSPWSGRIKEGRLFGRGACDMKAGLACGIFALQALKSQGFVPAKDILLESVVGEESGGLGTLATLVRGYRADAAIVLEPTKLDICPVQAGALSFRLKITGRSAHACLKKLGVSALEKFFPIFQALEALEKKRHLTYSNPLYRDPHQIAPLNVGTIKGGDWHSTVPGELVVEGRYGVFPDESVETARAILSQTVREEAQKDSWLKDHPPVLEWFDGQFEPGRTDPSEPFIGVLLECSREMSGRASRLAGVTYGSDLRLFTNYGRIPAVLFGPGDVAQAHAVNEFVPLEEVALATKILASTIREWCGSA